jgi:protein-S-isoprenylcysteine O-methyltransferase Ste14
VRAAGAVLFIGGLALALRSAVLLAGRGRPRRGRRPALILAGPYLHSRNPVLLGTLVAAAGVAVACASPALLVLVALAAAGAHVWVVRREEPRLRARFGEAYAEYLRRVPRWLPRPIKRGE